MITNKRISNARLLYISGDTVAVFEALGQYAGVFSDNGGDPDGPMWLADAGNIPDDLLNAAVATGQARLAPGYAVAGYHGEWISGNRSYCGYDGNVAYTMTLDDAMALASDMDIAELAIEQYTAEIESEQ